MSSKDYETTDTSSNPMTIPLAVVAQAEAAASNEIENDTRTVSNSSFQTPETQSNRTGPDTLTPRYVQSSIFREMVEYLTERMSPQHFTRSQTHENR